MANHTKEVLFHEQLNLKKRSIIALAIKIAAISYFSETGFDCGASASEPPSAESREAQAPDVYEAVFRHQFKNNKSALREKAKSFFLSIKKQDPSPSFLGRFAGNRPPVEAGSRFKVGAGVKFQIESLKWIDDSTVEVEGGYYEGPVSASSNRYQVVRKDGRWMVVKDVLLEIS
jgi:hypothetical protein